MEKLSIFEKIKVTIKAKKFFFIPILLLTFFLVVRFLLLRAPDTELTYKVVREDMVDTVQASGSYNTSAQTKIISPTNGIISEAYVKNGTIVEKGDDLFHVESTATEEQQKRAYAEYLATKAALDADNAKLYSLQSIMYSKWKTYTDISENSTFENDDGSPKTENRVLTEFTTVQDDWLAAEANYKNQKSVIAKDKASLSSAYLTYSQTQSTTVKAQASGEVTNFLAKVGDQVVADDQKPVLVISDFSNPFILATISEDYAARVMSGQKAEVVFDSLKTKPFEEKVENVDTVGTDTDGIITYNVRLTANNLTEEIRPKMNALVKIETLRKNNVIAVPSSAIVKKDNKSYVIDAKSKRLISVETGIQGSVKTEIISGLKEGTTIFANPN